MWRVPDGFETLSVQGVTRFLLQIVDATEPYAVVRLPAGGALERDLVQTCVEAIVAKGVGFGKTEAHVRRAIDEGMTDAIRALKRESRLAV